MTRDEGLAGEPGAELVERGQQLPALPGKGGETAGIEQEFERRLELAREPAPSSGGLPRLATSPASSPAILAALFVAARKRAVRFSCRNPPHLEERRGSQVLDEHPTALAAPPARPPARARRRRRAATARPRSAPSPRAGSPDSTPRAAPHRRRGRAGSNAAAKDRPRAACSERTPIPSSSSQLWRSAAITAPESSTSIGLTALSNAPDNPTRLDEDLDCEWTKDAEPSCANWSAPCSRRSRSRRRSIARCTACIARATRCSCFSTASRPASRSRRGPRAGEEPKPRRSEPAFRINSDDLTLLRGLGIDPTRKSRARK